MRIVVLTSGGRVAPLILRALQARGVVPDAVAVATRRQLAECFHHSSGPGRMGELPLVVARAIWRRVRPRLQRELRSGRRLLVTSALNSDRMRKDLERLRPDLLVLAGCGLITASVIETARIGVVNAHPGLLPWLRNNGVVGNAIIRGLPVGVSVHRVDAGIDIGPVLRRKLVLVTGAERTLQELEIAADKAAAALLADVVVGAQASGTLSPGQPQPLKHRPCHWLGSVARQSVDHAVANGRAADLFREWVPRVAPGSLELPPELGLGPDASVDKLSGPV